MATRRHVVWGTFLLAGCVQGKLDLPDFELTDWGDTLPDPTIATLDPTLGTLTTTEGMSVSSTSVGSTDDTTTSGDSSTTDAPPSCEPAPEDIHTRLLLDGRPAWEHEPTQVVTSCLVSWVGSLGASLHVGLACDDGPHALDVTRIGRSRLDVGDTVELAIHIHSDPWTDMFVAVRREGELEIAAMAASELPGGGDEAPDADFFAPIYFALLDDVCPVEQEELAPDCVVESQREAIAFIDGVNVEVVFDRGTSQLGDLELAVGDARRYVDGDCGEPPPTWYSVVAIRGR